MVSEKPPRRSKPNKEPVTIDLTAEETAAVAEPVRANDSDDVIDARENDPTETPVSSDIPEATPISEKEVPETEAVVTETKAEPEAVTPETPRFDEPDPEPVTASAEPAEEKPKEEEPAPFQPRPRTENYSTRNTAPVTSKPATSTLVASGIFGGIVALLLAGSMQYAGVLPGGTSSSVSSDNDVSAEIASLRQEIASLASRPVEPSADITSRLAALESSASTGGGGSADMDQKLAALEAELASLKSANAAAAATSTQLAGRLQQAEAQIADKGPEQQAARAVAAAALKSAVDRGGSFEAELQTYQTVASDDPAIANLQPFAAKGVLSRIELQRQVSGVADSMVEAVAQPDPDQGLAARLYSSALSVVKVRKVGDVTGNTPEDIVARFEDRLRSGDFAAAALEWETLPDAAKTASQSFKQELDARIEVENLVGGALTRAITGTQG
ncbi:mitofilin family membrane protein [Rhizobium wenxiniae]|uniref:COG4223 family protein n=1 Tax=Rhizobium wenxiniae TaxID=1737357 RepID=UPI003C1BEE22